MSLCFGNVSEDSGPSTGISTWTFLCLFYFVLTVTMYSLSSSFLWTAQSSGLRRGVRQPNRRGRTEETHRDEGWDSGQDGARPGPVHRPFTGDTR